jgi:anti-sigma regulatory factor (Ser/Thr protein kinase)
MYEAATALALRMAGPAMTSRTPVGRTEHPGALAPARARRLVEELMRSRPGIAPEALADALLVASELVTNAARHGGGVTSFAAELEPYAIRLVVSDNSARMPTGPPPRDLRTAVGGYGWPLVCRLAERVTVDRLPQGGKRIEAVLPVY